MFVVLKDLKRTIVHCFGMMNEEEQRYIPVSERKKVYWEARMFILACLAVIIACIYTRSILPAMFVGLPVFFGSWLGWLFVLTQHLGLCEDVLDHRLNCRTFYTNPIIRFIYWNMNYHIEHHMFPMVPYHALPALHKEMKSDCPAANPSLWSALKEVISALAKQHKDPAYNLVRPLPSTARPYRFGPYPFGTAVSEISHVRERFPG